VERRQAHTVSAAHQKVNSRGAALIPLRSGGTAARRHLRRNQAETHGSRGRRTLRLPQWTSGLTTKLTRRWSEARNERSVSGRVQCLVGWTFEFTGLCVESEAVLGRLDWVLFTLIKVTYLRTLRRAPQLAIGSTSAATE
jgi:hypothetical protein